MTVAKTIVKNSVWLILGEILSKAIVFFFTIIVARKLGVVNFGKYSFAMSFVMIFSMVIDFGLSMFLFREASRNKSLISEYVSNILILRLILCIIFLGATVSIINILNYPMETKKLIYLLSCWIIFLNLSQVFRTSFKAMEKMRYEAGINILDNLLRFVFVIFLFGMGFGIIGVGLSLLTASLLTLCVSIFIFIRQFSKLKFKIDFSIWFTAFKQIVPLALASILITYFGRIDNIILSLFKGDVAVGLYNASLKLVWMLIFIPGFVTQATFPKLSEYAFQNSEKFNTLLAYLLKLNLILTFPVTLVVSFFSPFIINLVYGGKYILSSQVLRILIWTYPMHAIIGAFVYALNAKNRQKINAFFIGSILLINVVLVIIVVQKFSYMGVAFATLSSLFILTTILFIYVLRHNYLELNRLMFSYNDLAMLKKIFFKKSPL